MRALLVTILLGGCFATGGGGGSGGSRPGVMPMLSELPGDAEKRDAVLDSSNQTAGPEQRKGFTKKQRKAETFAATAAAMIGSAFSTTQNTTLGTATTFDENDVAGQPKQAGGGTTTSTPDGTAEPQPATPDAPVSVPWVKLTPAQP